LTVVVTGRFDGIIVQQYPCYILLMTLSVEAQPVPLRIDEDGVARVGRTRVTLETVIGAFQNGASAEEIVERYDSLELADVYAIIGYYLSHKPEIETYLEESCRHAGDVRRENASRFSAADIRERLLKRRPS
jgi:uncharacterized protein (DUF433 family)